MASPKIHCERRVRLRSLFQQDDRWHGYHNHCFRCYVRPGDTRSETIYVLPSAGSGQVLYSYWSKVLRQSCSNVRGRWVAGELDSRIEKCSTFVNINFKLSKETVSNTLPLFLLIFFSSQRRSWEHTEQRTGFDKPWNQLGSASSRTSKWTYNKLYYQVQREGGTCKVSPGPLIQTSSVKRAVQLLDWVLSYQIWLYCCQYNVSSDNWCQEDTTTATVHLKHSKTQTATGRATGGKRGKT